MTLSHAERAASYAAAFRRYPDSHLQVSERWAAGVWMIGNNYRVSSRLYGAYPAGYLKRIRPFFPDAKNVLHVFSGSLTAEDLAKDWPGPVHVRVDLVPRVEGVVECDAEQLTKTLLYRHYDLVLADPPYSSADAERYGTKMPNRRKVLREIAKVVAPGGNLVWLDTVRPQYRKDEWHAWGLICLVRSTMHRVRLISMFQRKP